MSTNSMQDVSVRDLSRLSSLYEDLFLLVSDLPTGHDQHGLTVCGTAVGSRWAGELLVCGRAVNGWEKEPWFSHQAKNSDVRRNLVASALSGWAPTPCPMRWVTDLWRHQTEYNTARSAFWRVVRAVAIGLGIASNSDEEWSSHLAWTNLYRVAPYAGGNPSGKVQAAQRETTIRLLTTEMDLLRPRRVLFLTGANWATPILARLSSFAVRPTGSKLVQLVGSITETSEPRGQAVVASHPQGKPEKQMVQEILAAFTK